jgi:hypothetical protein
MKFRAQYIDASAAVVHEVDANAESVADVIARLTGLKWPAGAVRMVIMDADGVAARVNRDMPCDAA